VIIPVLAVPAAAGLFAVIESGRNRDWKKLSAAAGIAAAVVLISLMSGPFPAEDYHYKAEMHASVGYEMGKAGRLDEAYEQLSAALELEPGYTGAMRMKGNLCSQMGRYEEAETLFRKALENDPDSYTVNFYLGMTLMRTGRRDEAVVYLRKAAEGARAAREAQLYQQIQRILSSTGG
jgi:tetratricopeptide (TPR) repeat protein